MQRQRSHTSMRPSPPTTSCDPARRGASIATSDAFQTLRLGGRLFLGEARLDANGRARIPVSLGWRAAD
ncbi:MAG TPA: hypothetical protein EYQ31_15985, partial [Candidatus Handelsmanbacteria bacterium]|nr:hypothetical protein [Candidatus Handelsmanbacteria bacterium]